MADIADRARFTALSESTGADWERIAAADRRFDEGQVDRLLALLAALETAGTALPVSRLEHCLQTATRAQRGGESEAYVVAALLHDLGDLFCPHNHAEFAAALLRPYVDAEIHFIVQNHSVFQGYHYWHVLGGDRHARDAWRGHPYFEAAARFCALYDERAFDPAYASMTLADFEPMLRRVLAQPRAGFDSNAAPLIGRAVRKLWRLVRGRA